MPTYEYKCENCGTFEKFQKISASPLTECPDCKGEVKKIIGAPGIIFKGSGFYVTDTRSDDKDTTKETDSNDSGKAS